MHSVNVRVSTSDNPSNMQPGRSSNQGGGSRAPSQARETSNIRVVVRTSEVAEPRRSREPTQTGVPPQGGSRAPSQAGSRAPSQPCVPSQMGSRAPSQAGSRAPSQSRLPSQMGSRAPSPGPAQAGSYAPSQSRVPAQAGSRVPSQRALSPTPNTIQSERVSQGGTRSQINQQGQVQATLRQSQNAHGDTYVHTHYQDPSAHEGYSEFDGDNGYNQVHSQVYVNNGSQRGSARAPVEDLGSHRGSTRAPSQRGSHLVTDNMELRPSHSSQIPPHNSSRALSPHRLPEPESHTIRVNVRLSETDHPSQRGSNRESTKINIRVRESDCLSQRGSRLQASDEMNGAPHGTKIERPQSARGSRSQQVPDTNVYENNGMYNDNEILLDPEMHRSSQPQSYQAVQGSRGPSQVHDDLMQYRPESPKGVMYQDNVHHDYPVDQMVQEQENFEQYDDPSMYHDNVNFDGATSKEKADARLAKRHHALKNQEDLIQFFQGMDSEDVRQWILNIPSTELPDNDNYNEVLTKLTDTVNGLNIDGITFDSILRNDRLKDFNLPRLDAHSFIGKVIKKRWIADFYVEYTV